jgi:hypothetical protein
MIVAMSETPTPSSEPATAPVATIPPAAPLEVRDERRHSRLTAVAAWVGIVAGVVFTVAVIFFSGFILGAHGGGHHGGGHKGDRGDHGFAVFRGGPPPGFPMPPDGQFERPGRPGFGSPPGPGGPGFEAPAQPGGPQSPGSPTTTPRP